MFTPQQIRKYADLVFTGQKIGSRPQQQLKCPIHDGRDRNFAFNLDRGVWTCHSRCGSGGMVQLEQRLFGGSREEATTRLFEKLGMAHMLSGSQIVCTYDYVDVSGKLLFQKVRLDPKDFRIRTPVGEYGYAYSADIKQSPLYGLPGVMTSNVCLLVEGEKDADTLNAIEWDGGSMGKFYATTSGAADSWRPDHANWLIGKRVILFEDNDEKGRRFTASVLQSLPKWAHSIRLVRFEDQPEKSDATDFVTTHGKESLFEKIKNSPLYVAPETEESSSIMEGMMFAYSGSEDTDWIVEGAIQREGNGIIMGDPKAGKSLSVTDLILSMISGTPWHGCAVPNRVKVGLVTREDAPGLTKKRLQRLMSGKGIVPSQVEGMLWVNSRDQTKTFDILNDNDFEVLSREFKDRGCEIIFFDVFNRIHRMEENDNTQMSQITARLSDFGSAIGAQVALVHHINKDHGNGNVFNRLRGAGALHGWMEWGMAVTTMNPEDERTDWIRRIDFESKEVTVPPIMFRIEDGHGTVRLTKVDNGYSPREERPRYTATDRKSRAAGVN